MKIFSLYKHISPQPALLTSERNLFKSKENKKESKGGFGGSPPTIAHRTSDRSSSLQMDDKVVGIGLKGIIKRDEFVRVITTALYSLGYKKSGEQLEEESGIPLHSAVVNLFLEQIYDGNWDESLATLHEIGPEDEDETTVKIFILQEKFLELLDEDNVMVALQTLRTEIVPICDDWCRIRNLISKLVLRRQDGSSTQASVIVWAWSRWKLLGVLKRVLSPTIMVPEGRLEDLVERSLISQRETCKFHNSLDEEMSLYSNHFCGRTYIPCRTLQTLEAHDDEVWFVQFSHNGKYLASASKDLTAIIWEVDTNGGLSMTHKLCGHQTHVSSVSWSPNDQELLTCGVEEAVRRWDVSTGNCLQVYEKSGHGLISCAWFPSGKHILTGLTDKSLCMWELDGTEVKSWTGQRTLKISDLGITGDGDKFLSISHHNLILYYNKETEAQGHLTGDHNISSFSLSNDGRFVSVNQMNHEIHIWNLRNFKFVGRYRGHIQCRLVIRSCIGGINQAFIASGSEDSRVYIWHVSSGELIDALPGHSGAVNCVSWNPANPHMLASASDDRTIRIWGLKSSNVEPR